MAMRKVNGYLLLANLVTILSSFLVESGKVGEIVQDSSGGLPSFLQFTNDGVRVNFGGYHATAGLGGLLSGSQAGGGLHASAGTPSGAHASAGLGGLLNGDNANAGGGLHARAGLGNGRPEARAGLGGVLDGRSDSDNPISGGLYSQASPGDYVPVEKPTTTNTHTNIRILSGSGVGSHKTQREVATKSIVTVNEAVPVERKPALPTAPVLYGGLYAGAGTAVRNDQSASGSIQRIPSSGSKTVAIEQDRKVVESSPAVANAQTVDVNANANAVGGYVHTVEEQPVYNRWYFRKRYRVGPFRKHVIHTTSYVPSAPNPVPVFGGASAGSSVGSSADSSAGSSAGASAGASAGTSIGASFGASKGIYSGVNTDDTIGSDYTFVGSKTYKSGTLFDDIFNIPISTLNAVNRLLNNNAG